MPIATESGFPPTGAGFGAGRRALIVALLLSASACGPGITDVVQRPPEDLSRGWVTATPASVGVDGAQLASAYDNARAIPGMRSLLVVRQGKLVGEEYFGGNRADSVNHLRSGTKTVTALLTGIALRQGAIRSTARTLTEVIPASVIAIPDDKRGITVKHLLTMTAGFQWNETGVAEYNNWVLSSDQLAYVLARPLSDVPGQRFNYNSAAVHLLSAIIAEATGKSERQFAQENLFTPLGITDVRWETDSRGYNNGAAGLSLRPRDIAKIGALILQEGYSGESEIVPADWIREISTAKTRGVWTFGNFGLLDYGDLLWLGRAGGDEVWLAQGYGGQAIVVVPALDMVVVATSTWQGIGTYAGPQATTIIDLILGEVLPAAR